ncbi:MAG: ASKHA domain-containing protein [Candidatus Bathyarchaeia archaeon]
MVLPENVKILFEPQAKKVQTPKGNTVFQAAKDAAIDIRSECGGKGLCGKCRIIVKSPKDLNELTESERKHLSRFEIDEGYRLACQAKVLKDTVIVIPPESGFESRRIQITGKERFLKPKPTVKKIFVRLLKPTLSDIRPDYERLIDALLKVEKFGHVEIDYDVLKGLPDVLRQSNFKATITVWDRRKIIAVEPANTSKELFGFAVDIGTSKIVGYLVDLASGKTLDLESLENPQLAYGEDIITRITFAMADPKNLKTLQTLVVEAINRIINETCKKMKIDPNKIYEIVVVGNTAMHHLFLGIQPKYMALSPFTPAIKKQVNVKASELNIGINPSGIITVLPVIAGFVGADAVADALATGICDSSDISLLIDIGTNTEIFIGNSEDILSCSCASGPAFEGFHIKHGMKAVAGAIEKVRINSNFEVEYETIGNEKPLGLCGSAMVDVVAEMFKHKIIDQSGKINRDIKTPRLRKSNGELEFIIAWGNETKTKKEITVTQKDIREIQLAKAAIHTGCSILMKRKKLKEKDITKLFIAGAFGNYINPDNAKIIGLIPDVPTENVEFVGNTAIIGAKMALISEEARKKADAISKKVRYLELAADPSFKKEFLRATLIPHENLNRFPSVRRILRSV